MDVARCKNETQRGHIRNIEMYGVSIISVSPDAGDTYQTIWTYSIGFWHQYKHPEVIIIGLDGELSGRIINMLNRLIRDKGRKFDGGTTAGDILEGYSCYFEKIEPGNFGEWLAGDDWLYADREYEAVQMIWPDLSGAFPWASTVDPEMRRMQPLISNLPKQALQ